MRGAACSCMAMFHVLPIMRQTIMAADPLKALHAMKTTKKIKIVNLSLEEQMQEVFGKLAKGQEGKESISKSYIIR